jgi:hypothetical protein
MAETLKEYINFSGEQIAHAYHRIEEPGRMSYHEGLWTLMHPDDYSPSAGFVFREDSMKRGFVGFREDTKTLNLINGSRKMILPLTSSVYHFIAEDMGDIVKAISDERYSDLELIIDISGVLDLMTNRPDYNMYFLLLQSLVDKKIKHRVVNFSEFDAIYIDEFFLVSNGYSEFSRFENIYNYFLDYVTDKSVEPTRKVYLSRTLVPEPEYHAYVDPETGEPGSFSPTRMDDQSGLESLFEDMGFEIIYPEHFKTFEEQVNFFYSVKTVASLTSSGLSNAIFMQPGGTIVELITPLTARPISNGVPGYLNREFHNYYKNIAASKDHFYIGLPNTSAKLDDFKSFLDRNSNAVRVLKEVE